MPRSPQVIPAGFLSIDEQRLRWRASLSEVEVRSLASDYLRGMVDECNADAYLEFVHRFGAHTKNVAKPKGKSKKARRKHLK